MRKDLGKQPAVFPMPVLMVTVYDENGTVQVMNAAWGMICGMDKIALFINNVHRQPCGQRAHGRGGLLRHCHRQQDAG